MLVDSDRNDHRKGKPMMNHSFSKLDAALARKQISNAWFLNTKKKSNVGLPQAEMNTNYDLPWGLLHVGLLQKPKQNENENVSCFELKNRVTWSSSDWKSDSLSLTSGPRVRRARQRLLKLPRGRKPDLCQLPRAFLGGGWETIGAVTVVARIENRCGRRDKSGISP